MIVLCIFDVIFPKNAKTNNQIYYRFVFNKQKYIENWNEYSHLDTIIKISRVGISQLIFEIQIIFKICPTLDGACWLIIKANLIWLATAWKLCEHTVMT